MVKLYLDCAPPLQQTGKVIDCQYLKECRKNDKSKMEIE